METKSIEYRDPDLEGSFSFSSCYDFNSSSSLKIFSDNDQSDENEDDEESYIEIALEPIQHIQRLDNDGGGGECIDDEMELRISFSSSFQLPAETKPLEFYEYVNSCKSSVSSSCSSSSSMFTFSSTPAESQRNLEVEVKPIIEKSIRNKVQFSAVNRFVNTLISSFRVPSEIDLADGGTVATSHLELLGPTSNSTSKITSTAINNGMIMKLFIKFRALKLRTLLPSLMKVSQSQGLKTNVTEEMPTEREQRKSSNLFANGEKQSKVFELKLDAIRGVLESIGGKDRRTKSCLGSTNSSPIHHQRLLSQSYKMCANDNSLQAAIAHCKKSFHPNV